LTKRKPIITWYNDHERPELPRYSASQTRKAKMCRRAWWYSRRTDRDETKWAALGKEAHARLELWHVEGRVAPLDERVDPESPFALDDDEMARAQRCSAAAVDVMMDRDDPRSKAEGEFWLTVCVNGDPVLQLKGFIDLALHDPYEPEVEDLKTTANFANAMTEDQLAVDPQAIIYAADMLAKHPEAQLVKCRWVYVHSRNKKKVVGPCPEVLFTRDFVEVQMGVMWTDIWSVMVKDGASDKPPKGNSPEACTQFYRGCDYDADKNGGPCQEMRKVDTFTLMQIAAKFKG